MDELSVALKAREFVAKLGSASIPVSVDAYAAAIGGDVKLEALEPNEDAWSARLKSGKYRICVNSAHNQRRRRFSVCHEVAHEVLGIVADHSTPSWSYARRPRGEIACDDFAAELLLPYKLFKPRVDAVDPSLDAIDTLADEFDASIIATGSRFATFSRNLFAFVLSEGGMVRYCARSASLRGANAWIKPGSPLPDGSISARARNGSVGLGICEVDPSLWFEDWDRDGTLYEDARHLALWDQTLTLLWFEDDDLPAPRVEWANAKMETEGLRELDGVLPWPGRSRRRR